MRATSKRYCIVVPHPGTSHFSYFRGIKWEGRKWKEVLTVGERRLACSYESEQQANESMADLAKFLGRQVSTNHPGLYIAEWFLMFSTDIKDRLVKWYFWSGRAPLF